MPPSTNLSVVVRLMSSPLLAFGPFQAVPSLLGCLAERPQRAAQKIKMIIYLFIFFLLSSLIP